MYILSFLEGILTFISPCILPLLPVYFFYLAGNSGEQYVEQYAKTRRRVLNSVGFVIGFTIIFVMLGAAATSLGQFLKNHIDLFRKASGIIMIVFGLNFMGVLKIKFLNAERRFEYKFKQLNFISSAIFGIVFGFAWSPCLTAFLGSVLLMAASSKTIMRGILLLTIYSLGLGLPFIISAIIFGKIKDSIKILQKNVRTIKLISGVVLVIAGILTFTDTIKYLGMF